MGAMRRWPQQFIARGHLGINMPQQLVAPADQPSRPIPRATAGVAVKRPEICHLVVPASRASLAAWLERLALSRA
jgi:hypothetical protein